MKKINKDTVKHTQSVIADVVYELANYLTATNYESDEVYGIEIEVTEFDNCREHGYQYEVTNGKQNVVFCVYEHRNSDGLIINGCRKEYVSSYGPYNGESKYDYLASFSYNEHYKCASQLSEWLIAVYKGEFDESILTEVAK